MFLVFLLSGVQSANTNGYELKVRIKNLANKEIILGHKFADKLYPDDTLKLDNSGFGAFKGEKQYPEGIYFLLTPSKKLVDFFLTENQNFTIETDTLELYDKLKFENSPENTAAIEYRRFVTNRQKVLNDDKEQKKRYKKGRRTIHSGGKSQIG